MRDDLGRVHVPLRFLAALETTSPVNGGGKAGEAPAVQERTPWRALLALAQRLGVAPAQFWLLSLREWRALVAPSADAPMTRAAFEALVRLYPDRNQ